MRNIWNFTLRIAVIAVVAGIASAARPGLAQEFGARPDTTIFAPLLAQASPPNPDTKFDDVPIEESDFILGQASAPVTIVEYASLTCPHCARFHRDVLPRLKSEYIDTGKVRLVYRDFPLDRYALAASMLARCQGRDRYFGFIDVLYRDQLRWARARNPMRALGQIARLGGLTTTKFDACLKNDAMQTVILEQRLTGSKTYQVNATPTLIINGHKYSGGLDFPKIKAIVDAMLPKT